MGEESIRRVTGKGEPLVGVKVEMPKLGDDEALTEVAGGQVTAFGLHNHGATLCVVGIAMDKVEARLSNPIAFHAGQLRRRAVLVPTSPGEYRQ